MGRNPAGMLGQKCQELEFFRCQAYLFAIRIPEPLAIDDEVRL